MPRVWSRILRIAAAVAALVLAQSVWWSPGGSPALALGLLLLTALTWWRPAWGLVALAALAPFGRLLVVGALEGFPIRGAEAFLAAWLAGIAARSVHAPRPDLALPASLSGPWLLFGGAAVASAAVVHRSLQIYFDAPGVFFRQLLAHLAFDFHGLPGDPRPWMEPASFGYAMTTVFLLEGIALVLVTARLCRDEPRLARRLLGVSVASAAVAGALSIRAVVDAATATGAPMAALPALLSEGRWAAHVNKVNTAGSYFVLLAFPAVVLAIRDGSRRALWAVATVLIMAGLLLTASIAAILGGVAVGSILLAVRGIRASGHHPRARWMTIGLAAMLVLAAGIRVATRPNGDRSFNLRLAITRVSLNTAAEAPVFGVGIGTYPIRSIPHITPFVREGYGEGGIQPHNYLLQIGAELGIVGLGLFLWALAGLARSAARSVAGVPERERWDRPAALGLAAFLISSLSGQPMLVDSVAVPAFLLMGLSLSHAGVRAGDDRRRWIVAAALILLATVPWRSAVEIDQVDPRRAGYGTSYDEDDARGLVHFLEGPARLFVHRSARFITIEAQALGVDNPNAVFLQIAGPGVIMKTIALRSDRSLTVCLPVDPERLGTSGLRPLDVQTVTASGEPAPARSAWALAAGSDRPCQ
ncbi:MAG TPA: O-antigen ligase family protein [Vicinamibacterales bacterium]|nr:O-antigen ligase family protein [Vicinamibacterales bacterium]